MIFVFGSNLAGRHGAGAAKCALEEHGAVYGVGEGPQGNSYAVPTKDGRLRTLPLERVKAGVDSFLNYAKLHPELQFNVTRIGCGLAGFVDSQIGPLFSRASSNCQLPNEWIQYLEPIYFQSKGAFEFRFLSNFYFSPFVVNGVTYATVEHFYQAHKATSKEDHDKVNAAGTPRETKQLGQEIEMRSDWEFIKETVMYHGLQSKFSQDLELKEKLLATGERKLVEYAPWGDTYWGVDKTKTGQNRLGELLMTLRARLRG